MPLLLVAPVPVAVLASGASGGSRPGGTIAYTAARGEQAHLWLMEDPARSRPLRRIGGGG